MKSSVAQRMLDDIKAMPWWKRMRHKLRVQWYVLRRVGIIEYIKHLL